MESLKILILLIKKLSVMLKIGHLTELLKVDLSVLRLAIYELSFRKDIPPIVSINEAIDLGKTFSNEESKRFINGILDQVKRQNSTPFAKSK